MTRTFNERITCDKCGHKHTVETEFERWIRNEPRLDSRSSGLVRFDLDMLLHKYIIHEDGKGSRDIQCMMFVEVKTFMVEPSAAQTDTLSMLNQVMRNRVANIHSNPRPQVNGQLHRVHSKLQGREVTIKLFGGHLLQLSDSSPHTSEVMKWDRHDISSEQLIELLTFVRDPDRVELKIDHRRRSESWKKQATLF